MPDVICNSSCLIALDNIGKVSLLRDLYGVISITTEVLNEFGKSVETWIHVTTVTNQQQLQVLHTLVDLGEASTIALALEYPNSVMILDDQKARKLAAHLHLKFTGLLGILVKAKQLGFIQSVGEILQQLKAVNFRVAPAMEIEIMRLAEEQMP